MQKRYFIYIIGLIIIALFIGYNYIYQDHRDIASESADFTLAASALADTFAASPKQSELKFNNKTIQVSGVITELNATDITIDNSVFCQFNSKITPSVKVNTKVKIKGRCIGYDDLLEQVKLDQCSLIE
ncbi:OB-fold protein [Aestuariibaculum sediminum]|uniref:tRNA_anti-like n=1 Tax=Aestuariibaculum sediminum TaxID=2770637 RepID=A0A8J6UGS5_9FLAO|nr:hypothetical protein [Aestuariibaculum sediminum]MBD0832291.1 hypothetical protein [Aestuariibaculum sediminum]